MTRWLITLCAIVLVAGCSPVPSTNFETSQIALNTDVVIDVDLQETVFIAEVSRSGRPINLVDGDRLFVHYEDQRLIATQTDDGEYSASFPFIATGEYRIELSRPRDVSAPNTRVLINNYPMLLLPAVGSSFTAGEIFELAWEVQSNNGPTIIPPFYRLEISAPSCQNMSDITINSFEEADPFSRSIVNSVTASITGTIYSAQIDVLEILDGLERRNDTDQLIQHCEVDVDLSTFFSATLSANFNSNFEEDLETQPVIVFTDSNLAGGGGNLDVRSNSAKVTLFR